MKKSILRIICTAVVVFMFSVQCVYAEEKVKPVEAGTIKQIEDIMNFVKEKYNADVTDEQLFNNAIKGMLRGIDPHGEYYTAEELKSFEESFAESYAGVGMTFIKGEKYLEITSVFKNSPAKREGLKRGDRIVSINGENVAEMSADLAASKIKGMPGTKVTLGVLLLTGEEKQIDLLRERIVVEAGSYKIIDDIGYIKIDTFKDNTTDLVRNALQEFDKENIVKVIIDLRDNTGGILEQAVDVGKYFVPKGVIVSIHEKGYPEAVYRSYLDKVKYKTAVLVNGMSASASEVLAGAIQDHKSGTIIGTKTYGKGTVQKIFRLAKGGAMKLTVSNYYTPNGRMIDGVGIEPDITVEDGRHGIDIDDIETLSMTEKPDLGDEGVDVYNAEKILKLAGYDVEGPNLKLDERTHASIKKFQADKGLFVYGKLDFTTQRVLNETFEEIKDKIDTQLLKAIEVLNGDKQ